MAFVQPVNKHIKIVDDEVLQITVKFAENNLSKTCLKYSDYKSDKYYEWDLSSSAYMVIFELPKLFQAHIQDIYRLVSFYCPEYINTKGINDENFIDIYKKNYNKTIIYKDC